MKKTLFILVTIFTLQPLAAMESDETKRPRIGQADELNDQIGQTTIVPYPSAMPIAQELLPQATNETLSSAALNGNITLCEWLLDKGIDVNAQNNLGITALMHAATIGHVDVCKLFIARGANVNTESVHWRDTPLICAAKSGRKKVCELLIAHGARVNAQNNEGTTALMVAALNNHKEICELLITHGALANAQNNEGSTALIYAAYWERKEICELLIAHGAQVDAQDNRGNTALMLAAKGRYTKGVCEFLIDHGANVNAQNNSGETALHNAVYHSKDRICRLLLQRDANPNALTHDGSSVLMYSLRGEISAPDVHICRCVKHLLEYGADVNLLSDGKPIDYSKTAQNEGFTPLMKALYTIRPREVCELLLQYGVDYTYKTKNGASALTVANPLENQMDEYAGMTSLLTDPAAMHALMIRPNNPLLQKSLGDDSTNIRAGLLKRELGEK